MAIGLVNRFSESFDTERYDAITGVLDLHGNPPDGLIFQSSGHLEGVFQVFAVWESREHFDRFREERLIPAMVEAVGAEAVAQMPDAVYIEASIHDYVVP